MFAIEHLSISFSEKIGFINYCHKVSNPTHVMFLEPILHVHFLKLKKLLNILKFLKALFLYVLLFGAIISKCILICCI